MTPYRLLKTAIIPALADLESAGIKDSFEARRFLLAIALQESGLKHRRQVVGGSESGPAASFWQFEKSGGCRGVLCHKLTAPRMLALCENYRITPNEADLWEAMRYQDVVAAAAARLLIFTLPWALPSAAVDGWKQYLEAWRPGKPRPDTWTNNWMIADKAAREFI